MLERWQSQELALDGGPLPVQSVPMDTVPMDGADGLQQTQRARTRGGEERVEVLDFTRACEPGEVCVPSSRRHNVPSSRRHNEHKSLENRYRHPNAS